MTRGAGTTPAWVVPGPGLAPGSMWLRRLCPNNLALVTSWGRDSSELLAAGGAENTKAVGVPHDVGTFLSISGGTGCTGLYHFSSGISACAFDGVTKFLVSAPPPFCLGILGVVSPDAAFLAVRGGELRDGVKFRLPVSSSSWVGFDTFGISGCCEKTPSRECSVSCVVYAMERGTERTTTEVVGSSAVDELTNGVRVVGSVCLIGTSGVQEG